MLSSVCGKRKQFDPKQKFRVDGHFDVAEVLQDCAHFT
jgi:hypothetical protein